MKYNINIKFITKIVLYAFLFAFDFLVICTSLINTKTNGDIFSWGMLIIGVIQILLIIKNINFSSNNFDNIFLDLLLPSMLANYWLLRVLILDFLLKVPNFSFFNEPLFVLDSGICYIIKFLCLALNLFSLGCAIYLGKCFVVFSEANGLIKTGIYKYTRNPIYFGYFCANLLALLTNFSVLNGLIILIFCYFFSIRVKREEYNLTKHFGLEFIEYKNSVPILIPFFRNGLF